MTNAEPSADFDRRFSEQPGARSARRADPRHNTWARGLDVVVEGIAARVTDGETLQRLADALEAKYGSVWHFDVGDGVFLHAGGEGTAAVFRIRPDEVLAFAKDPHAETAFRRASFLSIHAWGRNAPLYRNLLAPGNGAGPPASLVANGPKAGPRTNRGMSCRVPGWPRP